MKIIDLMKDTSLILGLSNVYSDIESLDLDCETIVLSEDLETLFNLCRVAIQEFCTNYAPIIDVAKIQVVNKKYAIGELTNFLKLKRITKNNVDVKCKLINRYLLVEQDGEYEVEYYTFPNIVSINDDIDFFREYTPDILVSATCAYWAIAHGEYLEFKRFHDDYVAKAGAIKDLRIFNMPMRRWE